MCTSEQKTELYPIREVDFILKKTHKTDKRENFVAKTKYLSALLKVKQWPFHKFIWVLFHGGIIGLSIS